MKPALEIDTPMTRAEVRASLSLAGIYMLRMLGMFLILPVFSVFARDLPGATPTLVGLAISAYGLTQALFQIPFGLWSDRYGRKPVITIGLVLFVLGSALAALSDDIYGIIAGRALQGAGAVAAVVMALAADLTREEHRTKAMALIGISIGFSFALSMVAGPMLSAWMGLKGLFWVVTALAALGIVVLYTAVPDPVVSRFHRDAEVRTAAFGTVLGNPELLRLDLGIFCLHLILTATFVVLPLVLRDTLDLPTAQHWHLYLPVFVLAMASMVPFVIVAEKKRKMKPVFLGAIAVVALADLGFLGFGASFWAVFGLLYLYFTGFNLLEATLPSMVSKIAPPDLKGTAMGVYSTAQFLGAFAGGAGGGWIYGHHGIPAVFLYCAVAALIWLAVALGMRPPRHVSSLLVNVGALSREQAATLSGRLLQVPGVAEAVVLAEDGVAYLKVDKDTLDRAALSEELFQTQAA
ncbi:Predicted arabinose efflux permease, MFS family [Methylomagnum ishizawai]|uniref:Predicted arabinose efflux permease, MFS family n=2 Tax=Methylomagnum ishizawai TaxID=1760988 RepID=A0A1Y6D156_9GAMM|nr:Predicted arabinose efflux permease, MFS family [Methylomagnum ishizawai]